MKIDVITVFPEMFRGFFGDGMLEAPQYTRPPEYRGLKVPETLLGGNHAETESWRKRQAFDLTSRNRPDLLAAGDTHVVTGTGIL